MDIGFTSSKSLALALDYFTDRAVKFLFFRK